MIFFLAWIFSEGATALKLDQEIKETKNILPDDANILKNEEDLASGVSLENASYFENIFAFILYIFIF